MMNQTSSSPVARKTPGAYVTPRASVASGIVSTNGRYFALAPDGKKIAVPKELFVALSDFMVTRRGPGSITIEFQRDQIIEVEAVAKKRYPGRP